ncbi:hypothetical protein BATDEDRAFT_85800 [Batrachochytrium dendrobatidis JAM81]|uniref:Uncharacterized protein n=1 Tax=Batrachochytrium dendrobatidis (strain JAM81 / FGSC 10211) TaxID=684364 RepID=F4NUL7_BATDJ|nr:uncharacterized protein BATDEDRAFT_85800 [Batrachochytrium dendrobatidis JAM81]EGF83194.1 hypothetical protein BATDEDRAFT_85800 [Batrachochytrium dendrobatidis JAM81]|eukprot:XP_006676015.1 hypothetical protein BATDEDRAFT_85800 [Batrachochytrium dendrobatidis JAM81]
MHRSSSQRVHPTWYVTKNEPTQSQIICPTLTTVSHDRIFRSGSFEPLRWWLHQPDYLLEETVVQPFQKACNSVASVKTKSISRSRHSDLFEPSEARYPSTAHTSNSSPSYPSSRSIRSLRTGSYTSVPTIVVYGVPPISAEAEERQALHHVVFSATTFPIRLPDPSITATLLSLRYSDITQSIRGKISLLIPPSSCLRSSQPYDNATEVSNPCSDTNLDTSNATATPIPITDLAVRIQYRIDATVSSESVTTVLDSHVSASTASIPKPLISTKTKSGNSHLHPDHAHTCMIDFAFPFEKGFIMDLYTAMRASGIDTTVDHFELDGCVSFIIDIVSKQLLQEPEQRLSQDSKDSRAKRLDQKANLISEASMATVDFEVDFVFAKNPVLTNCELLTPI